LVNFDKIVLRSISWKKSRFYLRYFGAQITRGYYNGFPHTFLFPLVLYNFPT
jgi:hypothetical protein